MAALKYWLWLTTRQGMQPDSASRLLEQFGTPEGAYFADPGEYDLLADVPLRVRESLTDKRLDGAEQILADCDRLGLRILTMGDAEYPDRLKNICDPPAVLYVKGKALAFDEEVAVGVVGTRTPSEYGKRMAASLGLDLARQGALVVSGIAQGIDTEAVKGALKGGGNVVSVIAGGVDVPYPWANRFLYEDVAAAGALMSEYPPGTEHAGWHFPLRNRIISGLSLGVVAVECAWRSGTMLTVKRALDQDRDVFAVPGNADAPMSEGPNRLIREGAVLVTSAGDILEEYADRFPGKVRVPEPLDAAAREERLAGTEPAEPVEAEKKSVDKESPREYIDLDDVKLGLTDDQKDILAALGKKKLLADDLVELTQIPAKRVLSALTVLQVKGYVAERTGKRFESLVGIRDK